MQNILQHPTDLRLVVTRKEEVGSLTVLAQETIRHEELEVTFRIIGESHWITARLHDRLLIHEILSCSQDPFPESLHQHAFRQEAPHSFASQGYNFSAWFSRTKEVRPSTAKLFVAFPNPLGGRFAPYTSIDWQVHSTGITWNSTHYYTLDTGDVAVHSTSRLATSMFLVNDIVHGRSGIHAIAQP